METLTQKQTNILVGVSYGFYNKEIAEMIGIATKTVEKHRERAMEKANCYTPMDIVRYCLENGLVDLEQWMNAPKFVIAKERKEFFTGCLHFAHRV